MSLRERVWIRHQQSKLQTTACTFLCLKWLFGKTWSANDNGILKQKLVCNRKCARIQWPALHGLHPVGHMPTLQSPSWRGTWSGLLYHCLFFPVFPSLHLHIWTPPFLCVSLRWHFINSLFWDYGGYVLCAGTAVSNASGSGVRKPKCLL